MLLFVEENISVEFGLVILGFNQFEVIAQTLFAARGKPLLLVAVADEASVPP